MYNNPFERMKKMREDSLKEEEAKKFEKEKYAILGEQLGFTKTATVVPSFMKTILNDEDKNIPPFVGVGSNIGPAINDFSHLSNNSEHTVVNNNMDNFFDADYIEESPQVALDVISENKNTFTPPTPSDRVNSQMINSGNHFPLPTVENINSFPENKEVNNRSSNMNIRLDEKKLFNLIDVIEDIKSNKQFIALIGKREENIEKIKSIVTNRSNYSSIVVNAKKIFLYSSPYIFLIKQIINRIPNMSEEDRNVLWDRVVILLSATGFGIVNYDLNLIFEEELDIDDPIELIKQEFISVFDAYDIKESIVVVIKDFRTLEFKEISSLTIFLTSIFNGIKNLKFIFEMDIKVIKSEFNLGNLKSWLPLFDLIINNDYESDDKRIINDYNKYQQSHSGNNEIEPKKISDNSREVEVKPVFKEPIAPKANDDTNISPNAFPFVKKEETKIVSNSSEIAPTPPNIPTPSNNDAQSAHQTFEVKEPPTNPGMQIFTKEDLLSGSKDSFIRIKIADNIQKHEKAKQIQKMKSEKPIEKPRMFNGFDPSIFADEQLNEMRDSDKTGVNLFESFNAKAFGNIEARTNRPQVEGVQFYDEDAKDLRKLSAEELEINNFISLEENSDCNQILNVPKKWSDIK